MFIRWICTCLFIFVNMHTCLPARWRLWVAVAFDHWLKDHVLSLTQLKNLLASRGIAFERFKGPLHTITRALYMQSPWLTACYIRKFLEIRILDSEFEVSRCCKKLDLFVSEKQTVSWIISWISNSLKSKMKYFVCAALWPLQMFKLSKHLIRRRNCGFELMPLSISTLLCVL
jgi:hypothetical protein